MTRKPIKILVLGASLRRDSLNIRLAGLAEQVVGESGGTVVSASMSDFDCPSYDGDDEQLSGVPTGAQALARHLGDVDAFVIASPEYNASMPGCLKNVIDWASRLRPQPFNGKQAMLLSASPSMVGGNRGLWALRVPLEHLGARVYPDMFSLASATEAFAANGRLVNAMLQRRFEETLQCFLDLVEAAKHYPGLKKQWIEFPGESKPNPVIDRVESSELEAA